MGHESIKLDEVAHLQGSCVRSYSSNGLKWKRGVTGQDSPPKLQQLEMGSSKKKSELEKEKKLNFRPNAKKAQGKEIVTTRRKQQNFFEAARQQQKNP